MTTQSAQRRSFLIAFFVREDGDAPTLSSAAGPGQVRFHTDWAHSWGLAALHQLGGYLGYTGHQIKLVCVTATRGPCGPQNWLSLIQDVRERHSNAARQPVKTSVQRY